eukprot:1143106-Pelagomonas_calceolata.AAC.1
MSTLGTMASALTGIFRVLPPWTCKAESKWLVSEAATLLLATMKARMRSQGLSFAIQNRFRGAAWVVETDALARHTYAKPQCKKSLGKIFLYSKTNSSYLNIKHSGHEFRAKQAMAKLDAWPVQIRLLLLPGSQARQT